MTTLQFGLNASKKAPSKLSKPAPAKRKAIFGGDDSDSDSDTATPSDPKSQSIQNLDTFDDADSQPTNTTAAPLPKPKRTLQPVSTAPSLSALRTQNQISSVAQDLDPNIYDYDAAHDAISSARAAQAAAAKNASSSTSPQYMESLLAAAKVRERDALRAKDKMLAREREAEGDAFADKGAFVTAAYREQQAEARRVDEEEKVREEKEERKRAEKGMQGFYRGVMDDEEARHRAIVEAAAKGGGEVVEVAKDEEKDAADRAREMNKKGARVVLNDEGEVADKRQLLTAGLNVKPKPKHDASNTFNSKSTSSPIASDAASMMQRGSKQAMRERQTRMIEEQLAATTKRANEEEVEKLQDQNRNAKSQKTEADKLSAKERYLARKAAAAAGTD